MNSDKSEPPPDLKQRINDAVSDYQDKNKKPPETAIMTRRLYNALDNHNLINKIGIWGLKNDVQKSDSPITIRRVSSLSDLKEHPSFEKILCEVDYTSTHYQLIFHRFSFGGKIKNPIRYDFLESVVATAS